MDIGTVVTWVGIALAIAWLLFCLVYALLGIAYAVEQCCRWLLGKYPQWFR